MKTLMICLLLLVACTAAPPPQPASVAATAEPSPPGYLGLGVTYHKPDPAQSRSGWLMVRHVPDDGPAFRAGLTPQTVITAIDGQPITFPDDAAMLEWLKTLRPGQSIRLTIAGENPRELTLVAAELPPDKLRIWKANFEPAPQPVRPPS